ncbi:MAG: HAMP domain-containing histidine kinase [Bdellovibrionales bacterium]|nr:HAMP domain-containing histidine kinase [Bdellovibrionales bacterium]
MPERYYRKEISSVTQLAIALFAAFLFILVLQIAPRQIESRYIQSQKEYNDLLELTGDLRALSQRISFTILGRLIASSPKLQRSLEKATTEHLTYFQQTSALLQQRIGTSSAISLRIQDLLLRGRHPLSDSLDRYGSSAQIVLEDVSSGLDDMDFLLLLGESTLNVYHVLGNFSEAVRKESQASLSQFILLQNVIFITVSLLIVVTGVFVIFFIPRRIRSELELRHNAEKQLRNQVVDLEKFSSMVAHDLRSPLHNIHNASSILAEKLKGREGDAFELTEIISDQTSKLSEMIQELLRFSRKNNEPLKKTSVSLQEVVLDLKQRLASTLSEGEAELRCDGDISFNADEHLLENLFQNLIENSLRYGQKKPLSIEISGQYGKNGKKDCRIIYRDDGAGIPADLHQRIFEPYVQGEVPSGKKKQGSGLGLAFCSQIAKRHGGSIEAVEPERGVGAEFHIVLPR